MMIMISVCWLGFFLGFCWEKIHSLALQSYYCPLSASTAHFFLTFIDDVHPSPTNSSFFSLKKCILHYIDDEEACSH